MKNLYPGHKTRSFKDRIGKLKLNARIFRYLQWQIFTCYFSYTILFLSAVLAGLVVTAQTGIKNFTVQTYAASSGKTYTGPGGGIAAEPEYQPASGNTFTYNFGTTSGFATGAASVNGYTIGTSSFSIIANVVTGVVMRRVDNPVVTGNRDILFFSGQRTPDINTGTYTSSALTVNLNAGYTADMSVAFSQNNLLIGTDNIFSNQGNGNGNNNNIERVDVLIGGGYKILNAYKYGFPILERGSYGVHDAFKIAVITALDAFGNPAAFSNVVSANAASYNNSNSANPVASGTYTYFLFKRQGTSDLEINQQIPSQGIGGVAFRFSDFGIADNTTIYGYSVLPNDFNSTSGADVLDYTNSAHYPTNTSETVGGLDILAVLGIAMETDILPVTLSDFKVFEKSGKAQLEWTTATEINNRGFEMQRSIDGVKWEVIGFVNSKAIEGNSEESLQYNYNDKSVGSGLFYYRILQQDGEGQQRISMVRSVRLGKNAPALQLYPNPADHTAFIDGITPGAHLTLLDAKGAVLNQLTAKSNKESIAIAQLTKGIYFIRVTEDNALIKTLTMVKK